MNIDDAPTWWKILNLPDSHFERSRYAGYALEDGAGEFRIKDTKVLREIAPGVYDGAAMEIKEYNDALFQTRGGFRKYKIGKLLGSIPLIDAALRPELANDPAAQDKYWREHPELRTDG